jgi:aspartate/methionine/tyrosine aminotransferase
MPVSRLLHIPGIGVDKVGDAADAAADPRFLRLENLDTDLAPPAIARQVTHAAVEQDDANSYLPFQGHLALREAAAAHVSDRSPVAHRRLLPGGYVTAISCLSAKLSNRN